MTDQSDNSEHRTGNPEDPQDRGSGQRAAKTGQRQRSRVHAKVATIPRLAIKVAYATLLSAAIITCALVWGAGAAIALMTGSVLAAVYLAVNDVRLSIINNDSSWRRRHRILARIVPPHPLDRD